MTNLFYTNLIQFSTSFSVPRKQSRARSGLAKFNIIVFLVLVAVSNVRKWKGGMGYSFPANRLRGRSPALSHRAALPKSPRVRSRHTFAVTCRGSSEKKMRRFPDGPVRGVVPKTCRRVCTRASVSSNFQSLGRGPWGRTSYVDHARSRRCREIDLCFPCHPLCIEKLSLSRVQLIQWFRIRDRHNREFPNLGLFLQFYTSLSFSLTRQRS